MKKKSKKFIWIISIILIAIIIVIYTIFNKNTSVNAATSTTVTSIEEEKVQSHTISNTLTTSGQIYTGLTEKLELHATYYFAEIYVEANSYVAAGDKILAYTNGTYLTAPYDLVVTGFSVPNENAICTNSNYIEVQTTETLTMSLSIDESEMSQIKLGQEVEITVNAYEDKTYTGLITSMSDVGTYSSSGSTFTATVTLLNDGNIKIGMSASCTILLEKVEDIVAVPIESIKTNDNNEKYVVVVNSDGSTKDVIVETGLSDANYVQITSGLTGNETIQKTVITSSGTATTKTTTSDNSSSSLLTSITGGNQVTRVK